MRSVGRASQWAAGLLCSHPADAHMTEQTLSVQYLSTWQKHMQGRHNLWLPRQHLSSLTCMTCAQLRTAGPPAAPHVQASASPLPAPCSAAQLPASQTGHSGWLPAGQQALGCMPEGHLACRQEQWPAAAREAPGYTANKQSFASLGASARLSSAHMKGIFTLRNLARFFHLPSQPDSTQAKHELQLPLW